MVFDSVVEMAVVLSPLNSFMAASQTSFTDKKNNETAITLGPLSSVDTVSRGGNSPFLVCVAFEK